jgi:hypothetical protein
MAWDGRGGRPTTWAAAAAPSGWLPRLDPALVAVSSGLRQGFTAPAGPLLVITAGLVLVWSAQRLALARALSVGTGVVAALAVVFLAAGAPVAAGSAADTLLEDTTANVNARVSPLVGTGTDDPAGAVVGPFVDDVLYQHWLAGLLGSATSPAAVRYGPDLFRSQAVSWAEADQVRGDQAATAQMIATKQATWKATAAKVRYEDPDAYAYLTGERGSRTGQALWVLAAAQTLLLPIAAFAVMIAGYLVIRFAVMTAPAWAVIAVLPQQQKRLRQATTLVATALIAAIGMAGVVTAHGLLTAHLMNPTTDLGWLGTLLAVLVSKATWTLVKPLHTLYSFITAKPAKKQQTAANPSGASLGGSSSKPNDDFIEPITGAATSDSRLTEQDDQAQRQIFTEGSASHSIAAGETQLSRAEMQARTTARAQELQQQISERSRGRITMGVGLGVDVIGVSRTVVGTSEPRGYLRPGVTLRDGEEVALGPGHAETSILKHMEDNNITPTTIAAGRPICDSCAGTIQQAGATAATAYKTAKRMRGP